MSSATFRLYNTLTQQKEVFKSLVPGKVGMYVCGITAYDYSHLGHARAAVAFDVLYRYLRHLGYEVNYVRNFTDVDDKVINKANECGEDPLNLSRRFSDEFLLDMDNLRCLRPTQQPRVSDHINQIKDMISQIINNGYAYMVDGDVFFSVDKFPNYGRLSGRKLEDNRAGERVAVDTRKRNPADFALWKGAKPREPSWQSPWGPGRPGWHIECSAMSSQYLSSKFDIHGGGADLVFPHHENEIAQSCAACEDSAVTYWLHNGHVTNNNIKMSKSLGNFFTIRKITDEHHYHPLALRYFLVGTHYRSQLNYSITQLDQASGSVFYMFQTLRDCECAMSLFSKDGKGGNTEPNVLMVALAPGVQKCVKKLSTEFREKMADDLHTEVIRSGAFVDGLKLINSLLKSSKKMQVKQQVSVIRSLVELRRGVEEVLDVLGLLPDSSYSEVLDELKEKALKRAGLCEDDVLKMIEARALARKNRDYQRSDHIRQEMKGKGIMLMDEGDATFWRPCYDEEK